MRLAILWGLLLSLPLAAHADPFGALEGRYRVDPTSTIRFSVSQLGGRAVEGRFRRFSGHFVLAGDDLSRTTVRFTLSPESIEAVDTRVEEFIKSASVFDVETYPTVSFRSTAVKRTGEDSAVMRGRLSGKGVTRDATFNIRYLGKGGGGLRFHVTGKLSRALFKMDVGTPIYSNMVVLDMDLIGQRD